ncbi:MAG: hypothetical protein EOO73_28960 [Myxococcales bacterium]|nr:MAG: hypothetical protein EOO73_28960 [Myxococcales bacterium]
MSIDGIGKRGGVTPGASVPGAAPAQGEFQVGAPPPGAAASVASTGGTDAFQALERGEIGVAQYLDARVEGAVAPLLSKLSPDQLDFVRAELRAALETDPVLVELVRKTTGGAVSGG